MLKEFNYFRTKVKNSQKFWFWPKFKNWNIEKFSVLHLTFVTVIISLAYLSIAAPNKEITPQTGEENKQICPRLKLQTTFRRSLLKTSTCRFVLTRSGLETRSWTESRDHLEIWPPKNNRPFGGNRGDDACWDGRSGIKCSWLCWRFPVPLLIHGCRIELTRWLSVGLFIYFFYPTTSSR